MNYLDIDETQIENTFTAYQKRGYEFNILMSQDENVRPWLLTKYCNCLCGKSERTKFDFVIDGGEWFAKDDVFIIDIIRTQKNLSLNFQNNLLQIIINRLKNGSYVYGYFDEYYIKAKYYYLKKFFKHSFFLYAYDDVLRLFYAIGYTDNYKFTKYTIMYDEFIDALTSLPQIELTFISVNPDFDFDFKIESVYYGLFDYIHSIHSNNVPEPNVVYGIDTLCEFVRYVKQTTEARKNLDFRYSKFFMEFKKFMLERLEYLHNNNYIGKEYMNYIEVCELFQTIHFLFIKYNMSKDITISTRICDMIDKATGYERTVLSNVLSELKNAIVKQNSKNYI